MKSEKLWCTCLCMCAYVKIFVQKIKVSPIIGELVQNSVYAKEIEF